MLPLIVSLASAVAASPTADQEKVTYTKHVAPIIFKQCASCHRPGEVAPFSLLTFKDAAKRADQLADVTKSKVMPPWKAEAGHGEFRDARILSDDERKVFAEWAKAGAPEGDAKDLPQAPKFSDEWPLGKPDMVVKMKDAVKVPADGRDQIRVIPLPLELTEDKMIAAVDFRPGNRSVVHHALVVVDNIGLMRDKTGTEASKQPDRQGIANLLANRGGTPFALIGAWVPGSTPRFSPDGYGIRVAKGSKVLLQMHYHPVGKAETDQSEVAFYFLKNSDAKSLHSFTMAGLPLSIPAGEKRYHVNCTFTLPVGMTVHGIGPHMHQVGREMKVDATLPDGKKQPLIWIKEWDWNWQGSYTYKDAITLPKGTKIELDAYYDNSTDNPANPNNPPKLVHWGEQTTDEMCLCFFQISTAKDEDAATLRRAMIQQRLQQGGLSNLLPKKDKDK
jgi:mono/diheme cytochrome c family protein